MDPVVVAAAVIERDGAILLTRRMKGTHLAGMWEFPGGKLHSGESPEDALVRECREECGIEIEVIDIVDVTYHRYDLKNVLLLFYDCRWIGGEVRHLQVADHAWVEPSAIRDYPLPPPDEKLVQKLERRAGVAR